jgi:hypothetical protein
MRSYLVSFVLVFMAASNLACGHDKSAPLGPLAPAGPVLPSDQVLTTNATVRFLDLESGCWALETEVGTYQPTSLPTAFRRNGLEVRVAVRGTRLLSFCQIGQVVTVDTIRLR